MPPAPPVRESFHAEIGAQSAADLDAGLLRNVRILGGKSKSSHGRVYPPAVLKAGFGKYDGAPVNIDHRDSPAVDTPTRNRFGRIVNPRVTDDGAGIVADLKFNPKHSYADEFRWWVENDPNGIGFSHFALVTRTPTKLPDGGWAEVAESIDRVFSVDIVADPATTGGIFESEQVGASSMDPKEVGKTLTTVDAFKAFLMDLFGACPLTPDEKMAVAEELLASVETAAPAADPAPATESARIARLTKRGKVGKWAAQTIAAASAATTAVAESTRAKTRVIEIAKEVGLPQAAVTESLVLSLVGVAEESARTTLTAVKESIAKAGSPVVTPKTTPPAGDLSVADMVSNLWK